MVPLRVRSVQVGLLVLALAGLHARPLVGQPGAPLVTDRPDFTESALTVPRRDVQLESGYTFTRAEGGNEHALGEILLRIGLLDHVEARIGLGSYAWVEASGDDPSGFEDPSLGIKAVLAREETAGVAAALLAGSSAPVGDDDLGEDDWQPEVKLAVSRGLSEVVALAANAGYARASEDGEGFDQGSASLSLGMGLSDRWGAYGEAYGTFPATRSGDDEAVLNGGFTFLVHPLLQLDARAGAGLTDAAPDFFVGLGIARRW
jgi:hypothetical protein